MGSKKEYVLAEASKTLSLQDDTRHEEGDQLWFGERALQSRTEIGAILIRLLAESTVEDCESPISYVAVNDLRKDERFKHLDIVSEEPFARSLICLPLCSARGCVIGLYCVIDDKPRETVSDTELGFLKDMATTTMNHIEANRVRHRHERAEKMVKALALFLEGAGSLREWWLNQASEGRSIHQAKINAGIRDGYSISQQADAELGVQDGPDKISTGYMKELHDSFTNQSDITRPSPFSVRSDEISDISETPSVKLSSGNTTAPSKTATTLKPGAVFSENSSVNTLATTLEMSRTRQSSPVGLGIFEPDVNLPPGKDLQEALLTDDVKRSFSRASNLVREAIDLDGVVFFDASVGAFGAGTARGRMNQKAPGAHTFDSVPDTTSSGSDAQYTKHIFHDSATQSNPVVFANVLGYSTKNRSSLKSHADSDKLGEFSEPLLRILAKRYPHGKIFNFEDDGSISSSDVEGHTVGAGLKTIPEPTELSLVAKARKSKKVLSREEEAAAILRVIPGARSVAWFPMWDSASERWYAGSLIWTTSPTRILIPEDELTYMAAWGNSLMAEVSRLSALVASRMKVDFVSSISHELRSPLHGILASVEFLQEEENMPPMQADMINTINSCGKTLLDTIDHVLDFAKMSKKKKHKRSKRRHEGNPKEDPREDSQDHSQNIPTEDISDLSILTEEVIDSVYAGRNSTRPSNSTHIVQTPVVVVVDIAWQPDWNFKVNIGAFRRVLMNLFSNALKYTSVGYVKVSVNLEHEKSTRDGKSQPILHLIVEDSGKGISKEFLRDHLYTAFKQEDALNVGTGLGLSIVRRILLDINGTIEIESEMRLGTKATVSMPVKPAPNNSHTENADIASEVRAKLKNKYVCIVNQGFDIYPNMSDAPTGILSAEAEAMIFLKSSLGSMMTEWFNMEVVSSTNLHHDGAEVFLTLASDDLQDKLRFKDENGVPLRNGSAIIVLCPSTYTSTNFTTTHGIRVFYLRLPIFPHKLAKVLYGIFCRPDSESADGKPASVEESAHPREISVNSKPSAVQGILPAIKTPSRPLLGRRKSSKTQQLAMLAEDSIDTPPSPSTSLPPQTYKVLLVEDNEINLKLLTMHMSKLQQNHIEATNGREAFEAYKAASGSFDIIFMDLHMPVMDGLEATREIRRYEHENGMVPVVVVALTGAASMNARLEAFSSGMDVFLTKPVAMKVLKDILLEFRDNGRTALREFG